MIYLDWLADLETRPSELQLATFAEKVRRGEDIFALLSREGLAERGPALATLSRHLRVPMVDLDSYEPAPEVLSLFTEQEVRKLGILPLFMAEDQLFVAIEDPLDLLHLDHARAIALCNVEPVLAFRADIERAINRHYLTSDRISETINELVALSHAEATAAVEVNEDLDSPAVRLVDQILERGVRLRASDIHIERFPTGPRLRYRLDGILHEFPGLTDSFYGSVVSRIKILSRLNIAEQRIPQDGRATITVDGRRHDLRISTLPQMHGEGVVLRILNTGWTAELGDLGMPPLVLKRYREQVHRPNGLVLVTGPTGSGKTTTLYATLLELVTPQKKFISVEDPVENELYGINQVQVDEEAGRGFSQALRSFLRHDPDVAMLGEIRDAESAEIAVRAAQTGHLILSTLHTNDSLAAVTRLVDIGIPAYLVLSSLNLVLAQRLVRRLCPKCKQPDEQAASLPFAFEPGTVIYKAVGCNQCSNIGYSGRIGVYEMLVINQKMRAQGGQHFRAEDLFALAGPEDFVSLAESCRLRLCEGLTSAAEVMTLLTGSL